MGWTFVHKDKHESAKDYLFRDVLKDTHVEAHAQVGKEHIFRIVNDDREENKKVWDGLLQPRDDGSYAFVLVILTQYDHKSYYNFGYKILDEFSGPYATAPKSIMKNLSTLIDNGSESYKWALGFRNRANLVKTNYLVVGKTLEFDEPIKYGGKEVRRVKVVSEYVGRKQARKSTLFYAEGIGLVRPPKDLTYYGPRFV